MAAVGHEPAVQLAVAAWHTGTRALAAHARPAPFSSAWSLTCGGSARRAGRASWGRCELERGWERLKWWSRVCVQAEESAGRLGAAHNLADCRVRDGEYAEAERINRQVLGVKRRTMGDEHPDTLLTAGNLAQSLSGQGKHAYEERIEREVLGVA